MNRKILIMIMAAVAAGLISPSCTKEQTLPEGGYGSFELALSADVTVDDAATKAAALAEADYAGYNIALYDSNGGQLWKTTYDVFLSDKSYNRVPAGTYTVEVESCTEAEAAVGNGCMRLWGTTEFTVVAGRKASAEVLCTMANARVTLAYDESFINYFTYPGASVTDGVRKVAMPELSDQHELENAVYFNAGPEGAVALTFTVTACIGTGAEAGYVMSYKISATATAGKWNKVNLKIDSESGN